MAPENNAPRDAYLAAAVVASGVAAFLADLLTPLGVAVWIFYLIPLALCLFGRRPVWPVMMATAGSALIVLGAFMSPPTMQFPIKIAYVNRGFGIATLWIVAMVVRRLIVNRLELAEIDWVKDGLAAMQRHLEGEQHDRQLGDAMLSSICGRVGAPVAVLYAADGDDRFRRVTGRALLPDSVPEFLRPGDRLSGQALVEGRPLHLLAAPASYLPIASVLGQSATAHVVAVPLVTDGEATGLLEIAFDREPRPRDLKFLESAAEPAAVALRSLAYRTRLGELLAETQRQAEELQAQQEELRVANEELDENNRALRDASVRLEAQQAELEATNSQLEEQASAMERQRDELVQAQGELVARAAELTRANRVKSEFLANMSHELRTPLNSTLILSKLLADNAERTLTGAQVEYASTIHSAATDLLALINDILDLARVESGRIDFEAQPVEVHTMLDALVRLFQPVADEKHIEFRKVVEPQAPRLVHTDSRRVQQVLRNLLSNAFKFTSEGEVTLRARTEGTDRIAFEVLDTGIGIEPENQRVIFEAFRQANGGIERKYGGTGLGLTLSRELARRLGGDLSVASEVGQGSLFTFVLPLDPPTVPAPGRDGPPTPTDAALATRLPETSQAAQPSPRPADAPAVRQALPNAVEDDRTSIEPGSRTVLIVEDDLRFAPIVRDLARGQGFKCLVATTAAEAIALAQRVRPTAVLLDVQLPDDSGLGVLDHFKREPDLRHVPVLVMSVADYAEQALGLGAVGYSLKPLAREQILRALEQLSHRSEPGVRRLLVVEDSPAHRESVQQLLAHDQVEITTVRTGAEALQHLGRTTYDCIVLGLELPDMSGYDVLDRMAQGGAYSFPPVIVYTGHALSRDQEMRLRRYASSIIVKGARSLERLLDEVTLFLHQVESALPPDKQRMLRDVRARDEALEGRRLLLAEDDVRNVFALTSALERKGLQLEIARNGREALAALERAGGAIDLVLMDIMMPDMDGLAAMRSIRAREEWRRLPIIALTAKAMPDDRRKCLEAGASDYVTKPIDVDKLLSLIRVWLPR